MLHVSSNRSRRQFMLGSFTSCVSLLQLSLAVCTCVSPDNGWKCYEEKASVCFLGTYVNLRSFQSDGYNQGLVAADCSRRISPSCPVGVNVSQPRLAKLSVVECS